MILGLKVSFFISDIHFLLSVYLFYSFLIWGLDGSGIAYGGGISKGVFFSLSKSSSLLVMFGLTLSLLPLSHEI